MAHKVELDFDYHGLRCVVLGLDMGHRCGYVGLPKGHKYYGLDYNKLDDIEVHGGWTYQGESNGYPVESVDTWWIGFDCAHYGDGKDEMLIKELASQDAVDFWLDRMRNYYDTSPKSAEYVKRELICAVNQIINK